MQSRYPDCTAPSPPQSVLPDCDALNNCPSAPPNDNALPSHGSDLPGLSTCLFASLQISFFDASPYQSILSGKCALPPCQLALSPQSATPNSSPNDSILQPQLYPLNDSFPHAVESKSLIKKSHITPHLIIPKRLST